MPGGSTLRCLVILLVLVLLPLTAQADGELTFCYEDKDSYPWVMTNHTGLNLELLALVARPTSCRFAMWRCLGSVAWRVWRGGAMTVPLPPVSRLNA